MRAGQNPAKFLAEQPGKAERITVAILTHIPYLQGYYAESLEVLKLCLESLQANTEPPYDLLVFDNASGLETREFLHALHESGQIDYLVLSKENIGKGRAWDAIFSGAPGEIIAYADSDVYFGQGWLRRALEILEYFPRVGMVSCRPMRTYTEGYSATLKWAQEEPEAEMRVGQFMDWQIFREHDLNLGQDEGLVRERYEQTEDIQIEYRGVSAFAGAAHWQFLAYKKVLNEFVPLGIERPLGDDRKLDDALNGVGYLRLMTTEPLVRHLGNTLPDTDIRIGGSVTLSAGQSSTGRRLLDWPPLRRALLGIYNRIFRWYFYR
jgi:glycosyltransferase involved in cell wall biosynthesis